VDLLPLVVFVDPLKFFNDVFAEPIGNFAVPTLDDNFHLASHCTRGHMLSLRATVTPRRTTCQSFTGT
jgi:hypothetical protein